MKFFRIYLFPPLFGLLQYFTVRLLHDTEHLEKFWQRDWKLNCFEMFCCMVTGYLGVNLFRWLFRYYDRKWPLQFSYKVIARELLILVGLNLVLLNLILTPMAAFTDDGLSWGDLADLCTIPTLYAVIYYGVTRSSTYLQAYIQNKVQLEKITNDHLQTELKFLKSQYHPHFLFNALNTIYFQMDKDVEGAKHSVEKFSDLLRYQLYDQQQKVPVSNEMEYLKNYIDLQKVRSSDKLQLQLYVDKALSGQQVYPLLFLPLVENAFKFIGGNYQLNISAELKAHEIVFTVTNSVPDFQDKLKKPGGIGLENLKRRLDLLYPNKHLFRTEKQDNCFVAELKLNYE